MNKKIKVLLVAEDFFFPENKNGVNKINYNILQCSQMIEMSFLSIYSGELSQDETRRFSSISYKSILNEEKETRKISNKILRFIKLLPQSTISRYEANLLAKEILKLESEFDVVHISSMALSPLIDQLNEIKNKLFFSPIDNYDLFFRRKSKKETNIFKSKLFELESFKYRKIIRKVFPQCSTVHFVSDIDKNNALRTSPSSNYVVIPNGVDINYFSPQAIKEREQIIFTGNMSYSPNMAACNFLVDEVFPRLISQKPDLTLILAGGSPPKSLQEKACENIIITGFVDDLRPFINESSLFVSPLFTGAGIKNKVLEAMSMGKIVIGSDLSFDGITHFESEIHGFLLESRQPQDWAEAILEKVSNTKKLERIKSNARRLIEDQYSWESVRDLYLTEYQKISLQKI